jgi:hypothetical protein
MALTLSDKRSVWEQVSRMLLMGERSEDFAINWRMDYVSLLKIPTAIFAPTSEASLIWDFQAATSWRMSWNVLLISSLSSLEAPCKGRRGVLQAELILLAKARVDSTHVKAARPLVPAAFA